MSLRIKLPAKNPNSADEVETTTHAHRRKRRLVVASDEDDDEEPVLDAPRTVKKPRFDTPLSEEQEEPLDIETEAVDDTIARGEAPPPARSPARVIKKPRRYIEENAYEAPVRKKRKAKVAPSDPGSEEEFRVQDDAHAGDFYVGNDLDDEDDFIVEDIKRSTKASSKGGRGRGRKGNYKGKGREDTKEIKMKDERKAALPPVQRSNVVSGSKGQRAKSIPQLDEPLVDVVGEVAVGSPGVAAGPPVPGSPKSVKEDAPPPPKKQKLPTIKKNKPLGSGGPATPSNASAPLKASTSAGPSKLGGADTAGLLPSSTAVHRKPAAAQGATDFDLRDSSVYDSLFKGTGGANTPRTGMSRREKEEERRKELDKLRDEAKARRAVEARETFNLQAQMEKILRFEEKLKQAKSAVVYPNILGAKWKDEWERERRKKKEAEKWENGNSWNQDSTREEGEM